MEYTCSSNTRARRLKKRRGQIMTLTFATADDMHALPLVPLSQVWKLACTVVYLTQL